MFPADQYHLPSMDVTSLAHGDDDPAVCRPNRAGDYSFLPFSPVRRLLGADALSSIAERSSRRQERSLAMAVEAPVIPEELFRRIQREFLEMPGLRLTERQACRLWGMDRDLCVALFTRLVDEKFLTRTRDGSFTQLVVRA
jgi:hypothetical protein